MLFILVILLIIVAIILSILKKKNLITFKFNGKKIIIVSDDKNVLYKEAIEYLTMLSNIDKTKNLKK